MISDAFGSNRIPFRKDCSCHFSNCDWQFLQRDLLILDDFLLHTITDEREVKVLFMILNDEVSANAITKRATKHYTVVINTKNNK